ncbi:hypothetical protein [Streptomyces sp. NPDC048650]|uniref:hypothetical protein n=1 Tax=Streptomyces sp. NPDC048650 TaxID=3365583 RepID=UPI00371DBC41
MTSAEGVRPVYDRARPNRTAPVVVQHDLDQLKVGANPIVVGRQYGLSIVGRDIAPGDGWCRALYAPECSWPQGADICVLVEWFPDREVGSDWAMRLDAVSAALHSLGYIVERAGRPADPTKDEQANLLVYRMALGKTPPERPQDAWAYVPPPRTYHWSETSPLDQLTKDLGMKRRDTGRLQDGSRLVLWEIESALWPPLASYCARLEWRPTAGATSREIHDGRRRLVALAQAAGYQTRLPEREVPHPVEKVDILVYCSAATR